MATHKHEQAGHLVRDTGYHSRTTFGSAAVLTSVAAVASVIQAAPSSPVVGSCHTITKLHCGEVAVSLGVHTVAT